MRGLTAKQKKLIREEFKRIGEEKNKEWHDGRYFVSEEDFTWDFIEKVEALNPTEVFSQNFSHFVWELEHNRDEK